MKKERTIAPVVKKLSFKEAEEADNEYWAKASAEERLKELFRLRRMVYGRLLDQPVKKIVFKRSIHNVEN